VASKIGAALAEGDMYRLTKEDCIEYHTAVLEIAQEVHLDLTKEKG
jgi:hypothetical protein